MQVESDSLAVHVSEAALCFYLFRHGRRGSSSESREVTGKRLLSVIVLSAEVVIARIFLRWRRRGG